MFEEIKKYIKYLLAKPKDIQNLKRIIEGQTRELETFKKIIKRKDDDLCDPKEVIKKILGRDIKWADYNTMNDDEKLKYYLGAQASLNNITLQNEVKHLVADYVQEIALSVAEDNRDKALRYSINSLQCLMDRLEEIPDPRKQEESIENINSLI